VGKVRRDGERKIEKENKRNVERKARKKFVIKHAPVLYTDE